MEGKSTGKLSTAILILLILILIVGVAYLIFQNMELSNKQIKTEEQIQTLQNKTQEIENKITTNSENLVESTTSTTAENMIESTSTENTVENAVEQTQQNNSSQSQTNQSSNGSYYLGSYKNSSGKTMSIVKNENGIYYITLANNNTFNVNSNTKQADGSIILYDSKDANDRWFIIIYPIGANLSLAEEEGITDDAYFKATDNTKARLIVKGSSQLFISDVYYKAD